MFKRITVIGVATAAVAATALATAPTASANTYNGCLWPGVCFYLTDSDWNKAAPTASYQDVTTSFQNLGIRSRGADWVHNSRNDDRAYIRYIVNGTNETRYSCLPPNYTTRFPPEFTVTGIRIDTAAACP